jgi:hypothetical protein
MENIFKYIINLSATKTPFNVSRNHSSSRVTNRITLDMATYHSQKNEHRLYAFRHAAFEVLTGLVKKAVA